MPAPSLTEIGKLTSLGLIKHYQQHQAWYIQQGKVLVATMKSLVGNTKTISGSHYAFTQDEVGNMLYTWFMHKGFSLCIR